MEKTIITVAVTGALTTKAQNANIPYAPEEIAEAAIESYGAGAAAAHLHVRNPSTGKAVQDSGMPALLELYRRHGVLSTFFYTGYIAERFPEVVRMNHFFAVQLF